MTRPIVALKNKCEALLGINFYPDRIPQEANYPAAEYDDNGDNRDSDSGLSSKIRNHRFSIIIVAENKNTLYEYKDKLKENLDNTTISEAGIIGLLFDSFNTLLNHSTSMYEMTIDFTYKTK